MTPSGLSFSNSWASAWYRPTHNFWASSGPAGPGSTIADNSDLAHGVSFDSPGVLWGAWLLGRLLTRPRLRGWSRRRHPRGVSVAATRTSRAASATVRA